MNGELWGRPSDVPWAVVFPAPLADDIARHPSQIYQALLEGLLLFLVLNFLAQRGMLRWRGFLTGSFLVGYAVLRMIGEMFRQPDAALGFLVEVGNGGITMGMLLSVPMLVGGAILAWWARQTAR